LCSQKGEGQLTFALFLSAFCHAECSEVSLIQAFVMLRAAKHLSYLRFVMLSAAKHLFGSFSRHLGQDQYPTVFIRVFVMMSAAKHLFWFLLSSFGTRSGGQHPTVFIRVFVMLSAAKHLSYLRFVMQSATKY